MILHDLAGVMGLQNTASKSEAHIIKEGFKLSTTAGVGICDDSSLTNAGAAPGRQTETGEV